MTRIEIQRADIDPIIAGHPGNEIFVSTLQGVDSGREMLRVLGRYILVNAPFAGGVANLAGEIAVRRDLFRDEDEPIPEFADRSTRVAADVFYACIDEFHDRSLLSRDTHRTLAQATLRGMALYYGVEGEDLAECIAATPEIDASMRRVTDGYGVSVPMDERTLFRAMGFHAGSEVLADEEFRLLDGFLRERHPVLVAHLESLEVTVGGVAHPAYAWIKIHTSVEADHFEFAMLGANDALRYYAGSRSQKELKDLVLSGFREFAAVQTGFMRHLGD